jgi:acetylornithine deacetylase/succinyl-diaminopimelate desuccinylase-like protein
MLDSVLEYIRAHRQQSLEQLFQLLRIPSISTDPNHTLEVQRCAHTLAEHLHSIGMEHAEVLPTEGHPAVYADWLHASGAPTVLVYGHYDVQPVDPIAQWDSPPFEPVVRHGAIYARGASDDKGQLFAHVKAIEAYFKEYGRLPINLKVLFEGEEEIGSAHFHRFLQQEADRVQADVILISDTSMYAAGAPTICYGTRGLAGAQITVRVSARDLHSGDFGGTVANPIQVLADILAALKDADGRVTIPGFYDNVVDLHEAERQQFAALNFDDNAFRDNIAAPALTGEAGFTTLERRWARPTLDVNGILGGFTGEGSKTIIPAEAMAKITMRLVPNQDPADILAAFRQYVRDLTPPSVTSQVSGQFGVKPYMTPITHPVISIISSALQQSYGQPTVFIRSGGTIGVLESFDEFIPAPVVFIGLSQPNDNAHAPNEYMLEDAFYQGIEAIAHVYDALKAWTP